MAYNNRAVADSRGEIIQKTHYYPFGMAFADSEGENEQRLKYNGKELDRTLQLNTYDYAARYMDPAIGRFTSIDPLAEKYYSISPYAYVANNPLRWIDPDGKRIGSPYGGMGRIFLADRAKTVQQMKARDNNIEYVKPNLILNLLIINVFYC